MDNLPKYLTKELDLGIKKSRKLTFPIVSKIPCQSQTLVKLFVDVIVLYICQIVIFWDIRLFLRYDAKIYSITLKFS